MIYKKYNGGESLGPAVLPLESISAFHGAILSKKSAKSAIKSTPIIFKVPKSDFSSSI
jgi:hypothetical protein